MPETKEAVWEMAVEACAKLGFVLDTDRDGRLRVWIDRKPGLCPTFYPATLGKAVGIAFDHAYSQAQ